MLFLEISRVIKFAVQSFFRNIWLSVVTVFIIVLSLVSISILLTSNILTQHVLSVLEEKTEVYIDLTKEATTEQAQVLVSELNKLPAIKEALFITPEQTLENFKKRHQDDPLIIESLDSLEENPFTGSIKIKTHDISDFPVILNELSKKDYSRFLEIEDKEFTDAKLLITKITEYSKKIQNAWTIISSIFVIISILVVYNTIQINIYTQREEIGIMKLVGASNSFVRSPFLIVGMVYSLIAVVILVIISYPLLVVLQPYVDSFFQEYSLNLVEAFAENFIKVIGTELLIATIITVSSSYLATRKYLHV
ncbi:permease-like cell division protein FtsX [Patescibacteria group bacterium]|nr:permease-like cell division protein FtsX [Patescibacteria group bacterium]